MEPMATRIHRPRKGARDEAVRITTAPESAADDLAARQRRYLISMAVRVLCFIGAVVVGPGWLRWVLVAGAVVLPYVAVVAANAQSPRPEEHDLPGRLGSHREL